MRFLDTNVFIYVIMKSPKKDYEIARDILKRIEKGETAATSVAVIQEVVDFLEYNNRQPEVQSFLTGVNSYLCLEKLALTWDDFLPSMEAMARLRIDFVDALSLRLMKKHKITEIYSCDKDFDRVKLVKRIWE